MISEILNGLFNWCNHATISKQHEAHRLYIIHNQIQENWSHSLIKLFPINPSNFLYILETR